MRQKVPNGGSSGAVYKRTRLDEADRKVQRAEIRFDDVAGCLRTPAGGSSRQTIMLIEGKKVRSRLLSPREAARLMGLPEEYALPNNYNGAYHLAGDGVRSPSSASCDEHLRTDPCFCARRAKGGIMPRDLLDALIVSTRERKFNRKGPLCVALVITQQARVRGLPLDPGTLLTEGGGQVFGLGKSAVQSILQRHGITRVLASEGGRTPRQHRQHAGVCRPSQ